MARRYAPTCPALIACGQRSVLLMANDTIRSNAGLVRPREAITRNSFMPGSTCGGRGSTLICTSSQACGAKAGAELPHALSNAAVDNSAQPARNELRLRMRFQITH